jgi:hypothetical protein
MSLKNEFNKIIDEIQKNEAAYTRIAVVGQPGAGKSSLINNLIGHKVAETGQMTDVTRKATEYKYNFLTLVDLPGYGTEMFSFETWKNQFEPQKYDVLIYVFSGKLLSEDNDLFTSIKRWNENIKRPLFLVRNHCTDIETEEDKNRVKRDVLEKLDYDKPLDVYFIDCGRNKTGINELRKDVENPAFIFLWKNRIISKFEEAKNAYLSNSNYWACDDIDTYKKMASLNGINPFFGADIAVDVGIYLKMFKDIRARYGIEDSDFNLYYALPVAKKLAELLTKNGVLVLIKNFGTRVTAKTVLKYIPFVGQAASATISWKLAKYAGDDYNSKCYDLAKAVMDQEIEKRTKSFE